MLHKTHKVRASGAPLPYALSLKNACTDLLISVICTLLARSSLFAHARAAQVTSLLIVLSLKHHQP